MTLSSATSVCDDSKKGCAIVTCLAAVASYRKHTVSLLQNTMVILFYVIIITIVMIIILSFLPLVLPKPAQG